MISDFKQMILMGYEQKLNKLQRDLYGFTGGGSYSIEDLIALSYGGATIPVVTAEDDFDNGEVGKYDGLFYEKLEITTTGQEFTPENWRKVSTIDLVGYVTAIEEDLDKLVKGGVGVSWNLGESINFKRSMITSNGIKPVGYDSAIVVSGGSGERYLYENNVIGVQYNDDSGLLMKLGTGSSAQINGDATNLFDKLEYEISSENANDFMFIFSTEDIVQGVAKTLICELANSDDSIKMNIFEEGGNVTLEVDNGSVSTLSIPYNLVDGKLIVAIRSELGVLSFNVGNDVEVSESIDVSDNTIDRVRIGYSSKYIAELDAKMFSGALVGTCFGKHSTSPFASSTSLFYNLFYNDGITNTSKVAEKRNLSTRAFSGDRMIVDEELDQLLLSIAEARSIDFPTIVNDQDFSQGEIGEYNDILYYKRNNGGSTGVDLNNWYKFSLKYLIERLDASPIKSYLSISQMIADTSLSIGEYAYIPPEFKNYIITDLVVLGHLFETLDNGLFAQVEVSTHGIITDGAVEGALGSNLVFRDGQFKPYQKSVGAFINDDSVTPITLTANTPTLINFNTTEGLNNFELQPNGTDIKLNVGDGKNHAITLTLNANINTSSQSNVTIKVGYLASIDGGSTWIPIKGAKLTVTDSADYTQLIDTGIRIFPDQAEFRIIMEASSTVLFITEDIVIDGVTYSISAFDIRVLEVV